MVEEEPKGLNIYNYTLKGLVIDRSGDAPAGLAKHVLSGIHGGERKVDRTTPVEDRKDRHGRKHK